MQYTAEGTALEHYFVFLGYDVASHPRKKGTPQSQRHENVKARTDIKELGVACCPCNAYYLTIFTIETRKNEINHLGYIQSTLLQPSI